MNDNEFIDQSIENSMNALLQEGLDERDLNEILAAMDEGESKEKHLGPASKLDMRLQRCVSMLHLLGVATFLSLMANHPLDLAAVRQRFFKDVPATEDN